LARRYWSTPYNRFFSQLAAPPRQDRLTPQVALSPVRLRGLTKYDLSERTVAISYSARRGLLTFKDSQIGG